MIHPNAPSTERLREAQELADAILSAAGSHLRHYMPASKAEIIDVAARKLDALAQENARLREGLRHLPSIAENFLLRFNPYDMPEGDSQQWQSLEHEIANARRALNGGTSDAE